MDEEGENSSPQALDREASLPVRGGAEVGKGGPGHREKMLKVQRDRGKSRADWGCGAPSPLPTLGSCSTPSDPVASALSFLPYHISTEATLPPPASHAPLFSAFSSALLTNMASCPTSPLLILLSFCCSEGPGLAAIYSIFILAAETL